MNSLTRMDEELERVRGVVDAEKKSAPTMRFWTVWAIMAVFHLAALVGISMGG